jgi:hypothetical protein
MSKQAANKRNFNALFLKKIFALIVIVIMQINVLIAQNSIENITDSIYQNDLKYTYLSLVGTVNTTFNNQNINANFVLRLHNDSAVWVSIKAMGVEVARAIITPDSIKVLNHLNRTHYARPFKYVQSITGVPVNFGQFQDILVGNVGAFLPLMQTEITHINDTIVLLTADTLSQHYALNINQNGYKTQATQIQTLYIEDKKAIDVYYNNPKSIGFQSIPTEMSLKVVYNNKINEANFAYSKYNFAPQLAMPFKKPTNYANE